MCQEPAFDFRTCKIVYIRLLTIANVISGTFSWNSPQGNTGSLVYIFELNVF